MPDLPAIRKQFPMPVVRALTALGFLGVFFVIAAIIRPSASTAVPAPDVASPASSQAPAQVPGRATSSAAPHSASAAGEANYIGSLEAPDLKVDVYVTPSGPRYTVSSTVSGSVLATMIDAQELAQRFPVFGEGHFRADAESRADRRQNR